jgi:hypothetical protein
MNLSNKRILLALAAVVLTGAVVVLYCFPPGTSRFYPRCVFHEITGLNCPGCGGLRATHQLLHGHLREAFALNPLFFVLMPVLGWYALAEALRATTGRTLSHPFKHPVWLWMLLALVLVFSIARNLPIGPFARLMP